ncbi:MAG: chorismate synthase [Candidatus Ancillula sp.]|nr:chorismate synthase [Candidatus Ancillula sp.]
MRYVTAGESHGKALIALLEGVPAGVKVSTRIIREELAKRRGGIGRGARQKFEEDSVTILSGVLQGKTIGSPIAIMIENTEWPKWEQIMSPDGVSETRESGANLLGEVSPSLLSQSDSSATPSPGGTPQTPAPNVPDGEEFDRLQRPRPGHADLEGVRKYGFDSARPVLERASARETAARVAASVVASALLDQAFGVEISASVVQFGSVKREKGEGDLEFDARAEQHAKDAAGAGDTIGGVVEVIAKNVPPGLGSYVSADTRLDAKLAGALMSIQAVKGVEVGVGFRFADLPGSKAHDAITHLGSSGYARETNHAGGIEGGISNGEDIILRIAIKPIPSVPGGLKTVNMQTLEESRGHSQRSDLSAVYPARLVAKAMVALTLADAATKRFGEDSLAMMKSAYQHSTFDRSES